MMREHEGMEYGGERERMSAPGPDPRQGISEVMDELLDYLTECKVKYLAKCYELDDKCEELSQLKGEEFKPRYTDMEDELEDLSVYKRKIKMLLMQMMGA